MGTYHATAFFGEAHSAYSLRASPRLWKPVRAAGRVDTLVPPEQQAQQPARAHLTEGLARGLDAPASTVRACDGLLDRACVFSGGG